MSRRSLDQAGARLSKERARQISELAVNGYSSARRRAADRSVRALLEDAELLRDSAQVVGYWPLSDEVDLTASLRVWHAQGRSIYLPVVNPDWSLRFVLWSPDDELQPGRGGPRVPRGHHEISEDPGPKPGLPTTSLIPGRAFDESGARLGRGRGCYDRVLANLELLGATVGVAYACQVQSAVPVTDDDVSVTWLVDEYALRRCKRDA